MQSVIEIRNERERRGWTLDDVAERTRIPRRYLEALEDGNHEVLPPGPFLRGYLRQYLEFLGQDPDAQHESAEAETTDAPPEDYGEDEDYPSPIPPADEVPLIRLVIAGFVITLLVVLTLQLGERLLTPQTPSTQTVNMATAVDVPQQKMRIHAGEDVTLHITTDGEVAFSGVLAGTETREFQANQELAMDISDLRWVTIHYNGERIEPLGNLSKQRRIVFIHDRVE